jgi:YesN/AraC family two-component response regulator
MGVGAMLPKFRATVNKGLLQIFLALLLVAVTMFISNYLVYRNSITDIYQQVNENNKLVVRNMVRLFDDSFKNINDILYSVQMLSYNAWKNDGTVDMHEAYLTHLNIRSLISSIDYVEDVVIFHQGSDLAITTSGTISLEELLRTSYANSAYNLEFWKKLSETKHPFRIFSAQSFTTSSTDSVRKLIPVMGSTQISSLNVLVFLKMDKLMQKVNQEAMMQGSSLIVMDQNRNVILNTEEKWDLLDVIYELNPGTDSETSLKKKDHEYHLYKSDYNSFMYINKTPYPFANMKPVTDVNRQIMLSAIACAVILSALLSLYLYRPVRNIVKLVAGRDQNGADFLNIRTGIVKIQQENESFKHQMDIFQQEMRKAALLNAIHSESGGRGLEQRFLRDFAPFYQAKYFFFAAFRIHNKVSASQESDTLLSEAASFLETELGKRFEHSFVFRMEPGYQLVVIGLESPFERDYAMKQLHTFIRQAKNSEWKGLVTEAAASRAYTSEIFHCPKAFQEINECFMYRHMNSDDALIDYTLIRPNWKVYAPLDEIEKAAQCLIIGNEEECVRIIDSIIQDNEERGIHRFQMASVATTILYELLKHWDLSDSEAKRVFALEKSFYKQIETTAAADDMRNALIGIVRAISADLSKPDPKRKLDPAFIAQYIETHYMDYLHLDHMAEKLHTTPKYFSNYFKKTFGINFVEYLNKVRLLKAKEMMKRPELSIAEIGEKTGYLNASTFTSTFKKQYGISPSEYRKQMNGEKKGS